VGLTIVKKIIDSADGKIRIESEKGNGTTFFFQLPSSKPSD
jgi:signal transduction histidine kinase